LGKVIGDDQEIEGPDQLGRGAHGNAHLLSTREAKRLVGTQHVADHPGVGRVAPNGVGPPLLSDFISEAPCEGQVFRPKLLIGRQKPIA
jgi:hypothetical protein